MLNYILHFVCLQYNNFLDLIGIPEMPSFIHDAFDLIGTYIVKGAGLISWILPQAMWNFFADALLALFVAKLGIYIYKTLVRLITAIK